MKRDSSSAAFTVDDAIAPARTAHARQADKAGHPCSKNPLGMMHCSTGEPHQMAAALHAALENASVTALGAGAAIVDESDPSRLALLDAAAMQRLRPTYADR